jgi:hypothetical protein
VLLSFLGALLKPMSLGAGFRVSGLKPLVHVQGLGFQVYGLGFNLGFQVYGLGFSLGFQVYGLGTGT